MTIDFPEGWDADRVQGFLDWAQKPLPPVQTPLLDAMERTPSTAIVHRWEAAPMSDPRIAALAEALPEWAVEYPLGQPADELRLIIATNILAALPDRGGSTGGARLAGRS